ncbi:peptide ABC transporter permease [Clostridiales bacterium PH28_bin88]|nr:peptide ABC transporter permease [Clostridiales bacterium PH28_bin88]
MKAVKILERVIITVPIMLGVAIIVFVFMRLTPGDPVDLMMGQAGNVTEREIQVLREEFDLDKPIPVQLVNFLAGLLKGDLGNSFSQRKPVRNLIIDTLPATIELALAAMLFAILTAIPIGVISAVKQYSALDRLSMAGAFLGISMPAFWLGIVLIIVFSVKLQILPPFGRIAYGLGLKHITGLYVVDSLLTGNWPALKSSLQQLILPTVTLGATMAAIVARVTRSSMLEVLRADYVMLARAKGLAEWAVVVKHALRNALIPTVTVVGIETGVLLGGNMIVETIFGWPGIGRLTVEAIFARDFPLIQGVVMFYAFTFVIANLIVDILYTFINPKISL